MLIELSVFEKMNLEEAVNFMASVVSYVDKKALVPVWEIFREKFGKDTFMEAYRAAMLGEFL